MLHEIWLVIECDGEIMPTNIITKFDTLSLMLIHWKIQVTERTRLILDNSRAITPKCLTGFGWLSNLAKIFCQQTFSQSLMIIQWKLFIKLLSWQMLWTPLAAAPVPILCFFKRAYKRENQSYPILWKFRFTRLHKRTDLTGIRRF